MPSQKYSRFLGVAVTSLLFNFACATDVHGHGQYPVSVQQHQLFQQQNGQVGQLGLGVGSPSSSPQTRIQTIAGANPFVFNGGLSTQGAYVQSTPYKAEGNAPQSHQIAVLRPQHQSSVSHQAYPGLNTLSHVNVRILSRGEPRQLPSQQQQQGFSTPPTIQQQQNYPGVAKVTYLKSVATVNKEGNNQVRFNHHTEPPRNYLGTLQYNPQLQYYQTQGTRPAQQNEFTSVARIQHQNQNQQHSQFFPSSPSPNSQSPVRVTQSTPIGPGRQEQPSFFPTPAPTASTPFVTSNAPRSPLQQESPIGRSVAGTPSARRLVNGPHPTVGTGLVLQPNGVVNYDNILHQIQQSQLRGQHQHPHPTQIPVAHNHQHPITPTPQPHFLRQPQIQPTSPPQVTVTPHATVPHFQQQFHQQTHPQIQPTSPSHVTVTPQTIGPHFQQQYHQQTQPQLLLTATGEPFVPSSQYQHPPIAGPVAEAVLTPTGITEQYVPYLEPLNSNSLVQPHPSQIPHQQPQQYAEFQTNNYFQQGSPYANQPPQFHQGGPQGFPPQYPGGPGQGPPPQGQPPFELENGYNPNHLQAFPEPPYESEFVNSPPLDPQDEYELKAYRRKLRRRTKARRRLVQQQQEFANQPLPLPLISQGSEDYFVHTPQPPTPSTPEIVRAVDGRPVPERCAYNTISQGYEGEDCVEIRK